MKFVSKEAQNLTSLSPFWTVLRSQAAFSWCPSVQEILSKWLPASLLIITLGYGCSWAVLFWAKHAPNSENGISEDSEEHNGLEKCTLLTLLRMQNQLQVFLLAANFELDEMMSHKHGLAPKYSSKWWPPKSLLSRWILKISETYVSEWKSWIFTWYSEEKKSKLFGVT